MEDHGKCYICGTVGPLSREHVPPAKAYNNYSILLDSLWNHPKDGELKLRTSKMPAGNIKYSLCIPCNTTTGGYYGEEYVKFTRTLADFANPKNEGQTFNLLLHDVRPLRIFKQVLSMFCSTCGPLFAEKNPLIPKLILDPNYKHPLSPKRLYCYIRPNLEGTAATGIACSLNTNTGASITLAEVSWWPVGWVLTFDEHPIHDAFEVSDWWNYDYDEQRDITLHIPCRKPIKIPL